jgi:branched-subunit amino acid aminotransferase/4-amino-4-deoxychorismate lyase
MNSIIYLNGNYIHVHDAIVTPFDAGFLYGAGLFETILCIDGVPHALDRHLARLRNSADIIGIPIEENDEELITAISDVLRRNSLDRGDVRLKLLATPGDITTYRPVRRPTMFISAEAYSRPPLTVPWRVLLDGRVQAGHVLAHKSSSYLSSRMALHEAHRRGFDDALFLDRDGCLAESSIASLLLYRDGVWLFPLTRDALPGVTQNLLLEILNDAGRETADIPVTEDMLPSCAMLLCNSLLGPFPVQTVNETRLQQPPPEDLVWLRRSWLDYGYGRAVE